IQVLLADAFGLRTLRFHQAIDLDVELAGSLVETDVLAMWLIATLVVVIARLWPLCLGREVEAGSKNLLHEKTGGDGLQGVVHGVENGLLAGIGLGNEVGEGGACFARGVARRAA